MKDFDDFKQQVKDIDTQGIEEGLRNRVVRQLTPDDYREQKISFIYGEMHPDYDISREEIAKFVEDNTYR